MAFTTALEAYIGGSWVDLSPDLLAGGTLRLSGGIQGGGLGDRVAGGGDLSALLDNSAGNSAGLVGRFSVGHANALTGWDFGLKIRASLTRSAVTRYKWVGWIDEIEPAPGARGPRVARVRAVDLMGMASEWKVSGLATQVNKRSDEVFETVADSLPLAPESLTVGTGRSTFAYALDTSRDESLSVLGEWQRIAASELGYIFVKGDTTAGGRLVFQSRADRAAVVNLHTFTDSMIGLRVSRSRSAVYNKFQVTTHGRRVDSAPVVLAEMQSTPEIGAGESFTWLAAYRDPDQKAARVGAVTDDMIDPVVGTDYQFNSAADGSGVDLNASLSVVANFGGNGVRLTLTNNGTSTGFVTRLQARGIGIYDYEQFVAEVEDTASQAAIGGRVGSVDLEYESDARVGINAAQYLSSIYADDGYPWAESVTINGDGGDLEAAIFELEVGDRIGLVESVTGLGLGVATVERGYFIQSIDLVIGPAPNQIRATYGLTPSGRTRFWRIGIPGATAIGVGEALLGY